MTRNRRKSSVEDWLRGQCRRRFGERLVSLFRIRPAATRVASSVRPPDYVAVIADGTKPSDWRWRERLAQEWPASAGGPWHLGLYPAHALLHDPKWANVRTALCRRGERLAGADLLADIQVTDPTAARHSRLHLAAVSLKSIPGRPAENAANHCRWIARAAKRGAELVLFPELSLSGYRVQPAPRLDAEPLRGPSLAVITKAAREHRVHVVCGLVESRGEALFITQALVGPNGLVGAYSKTHLTDPEGRVFTPGEMFRVFEVGGTRVGINICFDGRHPASSLCVAHLGAEVILHPHGNGVGRLGRDPQGWVRRQRRYLAARAVDTYTYYAICNSVGRGRDADGRAFAFSGGAAIFGPEGKLLAQSSGRTLREHLVTAELDLDALRDIRMQVAFHVRRPEVYVAALSRPVDSGAVGVTGLRVPGA